MILKYYFQIDLTRFPCIGIIDFASPEVAYRFSNAILQNKPVFSVSRSNYVFNNKYKSVICFLNDMSPDSDKPTALLGVCNQNVSYFKSSYTFLDSQTKIDLNDNCLDVIKDNLIQINTDFLKVMNLQ